MGYWDMRILPMGERACLLVDLDARAHDVADAIVSRSVAGVEEVVPSFDTVGVYFDPRRFVEKDLAKAIPADVGPKVEPKEHVVPLCYGLGEDLDEVAERLGMTTEEVARRHSEGAYECFAIGFCPGFPYLGPLPETLSGLPRKPEPRPRVEAGSVGLTGRQTGIYTLVRPGGWWLVGRTPLVLVDVADRYFPIAVGDRVRFEAIDEDAYDRLRGCRL